MKITTTIVIPDPPESFLDYNEELEHITEYDSDEKVNYCFYNIDTECWFYESDRIPTVNLKLYHHFLIKEKFPKHPETLNGYELTYEGLAKDCDHLEGKKVVYYDRVAESWDVTITNFNNCCFLPTQPICSLKPIPQTAEEWFKEKLPEDIAQLAIENIIDVELANKKFSDFEDALAFAFIWNDTPQTDPFWARVSKAERCNTPFPEIPNANRELIEAKEAVQKAQEQLKYAMANLNSLEKK